MKGKNRFALYNSPVDFAHLLWKEVFQEGDCAIDATCGNGHDTLYLAKLGFKVLSLDIQEKALEKTKFYLDISNIDLRKVHLFHQSHSTFPSEASNLPVRLIVYNLGYLPGSDKSVTTEVSSTLASLKQAQELLLPSGAISITCYPGHEAGEEESKALLLYTASLDPALWSVSLHRWHNRLSKSPFLLFIQKSK